MNRSDHIIAPFGRPARGPEPLPPFVRRSIGPKNINQFEPTIDRFGSEFTKAAASAFTHPFQLIDATVDGVGANMKVRYGTVNDVVPTLAAVALSSAPTAALGTSGTYLVYLAVTYGDDGVVSGVTVEIALGGALPAFTDNMNYITVGEVDVAEVATFLVVTELRQAVTHSLRHAICDRVIEDSVITEPGVPYFWGV